LASRFALRSRPKVPRRWPGLSASWTSCNARQVHRTTTIDGNRGAPPREDQGQESRSAEDEPRTTARLRGYKGPRKRARLQEACEAWKVRRLILQTMSQECEFPREEVPALRVSIWELMEHRARTNTSSNGTDRQNSQRQQTSTAQTGTNQPIKDTSSKG